MGGCTPTSCSLSLGPRSGSCGGHGIHPTLGCTEVSRTRLAPLQVRGTPAGGWGSGGFGGQRGRVWGQGGHGGVCKMQMEASSWRQELGVRGQEEPETGGREGRRVKGGSGEKKGVPLSWSPSLCSCTPQAPHKAKICPVLPLGRFPHPLLHPDHPTNLGYPLTRTLCPPKAS